MVAHCFHTWHVPISAVRAHRTTVARQTQEKRTSYRPPRPRHRIDPLQDRRSEASTPAAVACDSARNAVRAKVECMPVRVITSEASLANASSMPEKPCAQSNLGADRLEREQALAQQHGFLPTRTQVTTVRAEGQVTTIAFDEHSSA